MSELRSIRIITPKTPQKEYYDIGDGLLFTIYPGNSDNFPTNLWEREVVIYLETDTCGTLIGMTSMLSDLQELWPRIDIGSVTRGFIVHHPKATESAMEIVTTIQTKIPKATIVQAVAVRAYPGLTVIQPDELEGEWRDRLMFPQLVRFFDWCSRRKKQRRPPLLESQVQIVEGYHKKKRRSF